MDFLQNREQYVASDKPLDMILGSSVASQDIYGQAICEALELVRKNTNQQRIHAATTPNVLRESLKQIDIFPQTGECLFPIIREIGEPAVFNALNVGNPATMAHLHCPVAIPALVAELLISATNQSLDSWDQSPFATLIEERLLSWLTQFFGLPESAGGSFTSGGSQSNMTALYLAAERGGLDARTKGVIFTSERSHFSIHKNAFILGFPESSVISIKTDVDGRLIAQDLRTAIENVLAEQKFPVAIVATAGTTDLGSIDPLPEVADIAAEYNLWLHVDAAYGGGLMFSRHRGHLAGIERATSITLDFHKMLFQPISASVLLLRNQTDFLPLSMKSDYLNPQTPVFEDLPNLVEYSMQTTRRSDALKVLMTLRVLGREGLDFLICQTLQNAEAAAQAIRERSYLELARPPFLSTVLFRYISFRGEQHADELTLAIRSRLFSSGKAALATTVFNGHIYFKLTLLNPNSTSDVICSVLDAIKNAAQEMEGKYV